MGMAELIDKWEVVNKLIQLENQYNFYKEKWDADVLYRRIVELEIGIGKTHGLEVVYCKDCIRSKRCKTRFFLEGYHRIQNPFCAAGERREGK